ncbi:cadherin EGF LAG seven-pass G-type receptor 1-like [Plectropomus leopardus]|uniref:cadherin EGF LAG seven-pass G-type receptor 1-like n=1 Tax=Plectropomus leopardus TaxID=160734 RepID=UPI001C4D3B96|nr:cadherin EGF LAG seven-pass G-type receptor 1-like [Plectropomus leopardus]
MEKSGAIPALRMAFLLLLLISATWMLGLMAVNSDVMTFHYLFAVFSALQGVFIFFFHVVFNKEVRKNLKNVFTGKKSVPDESSTTRASLLTRSLNCNNTYTEDGPLYRSGIGESTVSLDSTLRSAKSRSSYLAYALRYNMLTDRMAASTTLLHEECVYVCTCVAVCPFQTSLFVVFLCYPSCTSAHASRVSQILTHPKPLIYRHTQRYTHTLSP